MTCTSPRVITIPAKPELARNGAIRRQLRVAAYCRVSTDDEEQLTSYEAQQSYYTDKIMTNSEWTMAGIFADACVIIGQTGQSLAATGFAPFWSYTDSFNSTEGDNRRKTKFVVGSALTLWSFKAKRDSRPATDAIRQLQGGRFAVGAIQLPFHITVMITLYAGS